MKKNPWVLVLMSFYAIGLKALFDQWQSYQFPDKLPDEYRISYEDIYTKLQEEDDEEWNEMFFELISYNYSRITQTGYLYVEWEEFEGYLNKVYQKIGPNKIAKAADIKI